MKTAGKRKSAWSPEPLEHGLNAFDDWGLGHGRDFVYRGLSFDDSTLLPVIVGFKEGGNPSNFPDDTTTLGTGEVVSHEHFVTPFPYSVSGLVGRDRQYYTLLAPPRFFQSLADDPTLRKYVTQLRIGPALPPDAICIGSHRAVAPKVSWKPAPKVITAVIDGSIAIGHERFRTADNKSRVAYAWIMDGACAGSGAVSIGREYCKDEIDAHLAASTHDGVVDEDEFMRRIGLRDLSRERYRGIVPRVAHGTHVADIAAGYDPDENRADRPIIFVQLPSAATADTSGYLLEPMVMWAMDYIVARAGLLLDDDEKQGENEKPPVRLAVNFSYGVNAGPHDGSHPIERTFDALLRSGNQGDKRLAVTLPAGNSEAASGHAEVRFTKKNKGRAEFDWCVLPDDRSCSYLEIWMPPEPADASRLSVSVAPPDSDDWATLGEADREGMVYKPHGSVICKMSYEQVVTERKTDGTPTARGRFFVALTPSNEDVAPSRLAGAGAWRVRLTNQRLGTKQTVDLWVQRDDTPISFRQRGRQSYLRVDSGACRDATAEVTRGGTVNAIGTGEDTIVVGGARRRDLGVLAYSASGANTEYQLGQAVRSIRGADAMAASEGGVAHPGVLAAGGMAGGAVRLGGTSVAAPAVTRFAADCFAAGDDLCGRTEIRQLAERHEAEHRAPNRPSNDKGGGGRLDLPSGRPVRRFERALPGSKKR